MMFRALIFCSAACLSTGCVAGAAVGLVGDVAEGTVRGVGEVAEGAYNVTKGAVDLAVPDGPDGRGDADAIYDDPYD